MSTPPHVLVPAQHPAGSIMTIRDPATVHHLRGVLRLRVGDGIVCFDGRGWQGRGTISRCRGRQVLVAIHEESQATPMTRRLTLAQALIKLPRFEWVLEKATELGVDTIVPVMTERSVGRHTEWSQSAKLTRWRRIVAAAASQCGRATLPELLVPRSFSEVMTTFAPGAILLCTLNEAAIPLGRCLDLLSPLARVVVCIGPEGDFTPEEVALARGVGAHLVRLGNRILRSETAGVATLSILQHARGTL